MNTIRQTEGDVDTTKKRLRDLGVIWNDSGKEIRTEMEIPLS